MKSEKFSKSRASGIVALIITVLFIQGLLYLFNKEEIKPPLDKDVKPSERLDTYPNMDSSMKKSTERKKIHNRGKVAGTQYRKGKEYQNKRAFLQEKNSRDSSRSEEKKIATYHSTREVKLYEPRTFEKPSRRLVQLNTADSMELVSLPGIGPFYAKKILQYREKLGGFAEKGQLLEIFGIDDERFALISDRVDVDTNLIVKIDIKDASYEQLARNPYIGGYIARSIIRFRESRGEEKTDLATLLLCNIIKNDVYKILKFYIR